MILIADLGATNARFCITEDGNSYSNKVSYPINSFDGLEKLCNAYLASQDLVGIQKAVIGENPTNLNEGKVEVPWNNNKVVFDFVALSYRNPSKNQYSYYMDGYEDDWIDSGNRRFATYTNLPAGNYTFKVKGSNNDGIWNENNPPTKFAAPLTKPPSASVF
mgnify:CR=1 FL=1